MSVQIQMRRGTAAQWTAANTLLAEGEIGLELDTQKIKMGDGVTTWTTLPYFTGSSGSGTVTSVALTVPTGLSISGSPITTSGTLAITLQTGYSIPLNSDQSNWNTAYGWGNHASAGYLTSSDIGSTVQGYDADLSAIAALTGTSGLLKKTAANTWSLDTNTYLTSFTETDPIYTASSWYTTTNNSSNWNTAYGWGNHASAGYLVASNNLSDLVSASTARTNLGLGTMAVANTSSYTVTGSDTTYAYRANNLSDLANAATARTNLGLGTMATASASSYTVTGSDTTYAYRANNLSDLANAATARTNLGLGTAATMTGPSGTIVGTTDTQTLTNKRITPRVSTTTSSATPTINTDNVDMYGLTAQAVDITSFTTNLSGTPTDGQKLWIYIVGTAARAITWGTSFESSTATLPTTTVTTNRLDVGFVWNAATSKWRCVAVA